jgi:hypothetical protein
VEKVIVYKARTNTLPVNLGIDVSADTFTSEVRVDRDHTSTLLMEWTVAFDTDGTDGKLILTVDDIVTGQILPSSGWMDLKRVTGSEPVQVFDPIEVEFRGSVTA